MKSLWPWLCAILSGVLLALAYPPFDLGGLAWFALAPLVAALWFGPRWARFDPLRLALLGFVTGLLYFLGSLEWLVTVTIPGWIALCAFLALYPTVWALFVGTAGRPADGLAERSPWLSSRRNLLTAALGAAAWASLEWLRGVLVFGGFGWNGLGVTLHGNIALIQLTDLTGVGGLSFLLVMANLMIVLTGRRLQMEFGLRRLRPHYDFSITVGLVALAFLYGVRQFYTPAPPSETLSIAAVQTDVPILEKRDPVQEERILTLHRELSEKALILKPDLLVWPEAATPKAVFSDQHNWDVVRGVAEKHDGDFLLGSVYFGPDGDYNSAILLTGKGTAAQIYNKIHLVPFGEYVPLRKSFPLFAWLVGDLVPEDFDFGKAPKVLEMKAKPVKIAALICFEDTLGDLSRRFVQLGAQLFVTVTNDGWFLRSAGSVQHLYQAVFRCAETKIPMVRAANTGVSCVVDRLGRVQQTLEDAKGNTFIQGLLVAPVAVPKDPPQTFFTRYGELFSQVCTGVSVLAALLAFVRRKA